MDVEYIKNCITIVSPDKKIASFVISNADLDIIKLRDYLKKFLPYYMIPSHIIRINEIPSNQNGKLDTEELIKKINESKNNRTNIMYASTETEKKIQSVLISLLKLDIEKIDMNNNFFELGGDSLLAIGLATFVEKEFHITISAKEIFDADTIKSICRIIDDKTSLRAETSNVSSIPKTTLNCLPISSAQRRIYYACKVIGDNNLVYNTPGAILIDCLLDSAKTERVFQDIIKKQSSFRTVFVLENDEVQQKILDSVNFNVEVTHNKEQNIDNIINNFAKPFDLEHAPLLRVQICYLDNKKTLLLLDSHHIIMDGTSLSILINDFCKLYNGNSINDLLIEYKDYSVWENNFINSDNIKKFEEYWLNKYKNFKFQKLNLPYDYQNSSTNSYIGNRVIKSIDSSFFTRIEELSLKLNVSPYMLFLSAFFILLYKYTGQDEIVVGTPFANRNIPETQNIIGMFVNNLSINAKVDSNVSFTEFLQLIKSQTLLDIDNGMYPYDLLVRKLNISSNFALFDVMFAFQNIANNAFSIDNTIAKLIPANLDIAKFNLSLEINPNEHFINIEYRSDLFKKKTIDSFYEHYMNILNDILNNSDKLIKDISMISEEEREEILYKFNNRKLPYPSASNLVEMFNNIVNKCSDKIAVSSKEGILTYKELDEKSNTLANKIIKYGIKPHSTIGVCLHRSPELIISIWAILKANCVYMPMYTDYPTDRLLYMLENSNAKLLITTKTLANKINFVGKKEIIDNFSIIGNSSNILTTINILPDDEAYTIYTSGSTGKPKGVVISHKNLINFIYNFKHFYDGITEKDVFLASTNISFDVSIWEFFLPILNGAKLVLYSEELIRDIIKYCKTIIDYGVTALYIAPNILNEVYEVLKDCTNITINKLLVGVEPIRKSTLNKYLQLNPNLHIVNGYGPTETTICCTALNYSFDNRDDDIVPIGYPLFNNNIYILNKDNQLQPIGLPGEIYVSGDGVGLGYINNRIENTKNFINNTYDNASDKIYRTGDLAKWLTNGTIKFIGRNDSQVKIAGHRIELREINSVVMKYPNITTAYTTVYSKGTNKYIVSYYTADKDVPKADLVAFLKSKLADYMIPNFLMQIEAFPLTSNGKIDKNSLPTSFITAKKKYTAPRNDFETTVTNIWKKLLFVKKLGIDDNFFELGGDSLLAIKFQLEATKLGLNISYSDIFSYPTIRNLSEKISNFNTFSFNNNYDYSKIDKLISKNSVDKLNYHIVEKNNNIGNILLLGSTGFLGAHILNEFLSTQSGIAYCLIRQKTLLEPEERLRKTLNFYFGNKYDNYFGNRIVVIQGDITNQTFTLSNADLEDLAENISTVIHSAALVKHYGSYEHFNDINVIGTKNITDFCYKFNKKLYYISTLSISGNDNMEDNTIKYFKESNFFINQNLNNIYIYTKFEAEKIILEKIQDGLKACILRVGNITNRYSDGKFQINVSENAFVNRIKSFLSLGIMLNKFLEHHIEFTPVDYCASAIIKIIASNSNFTIFHLFNDNTIKCGDLLNILSQLGITLSNVTDEEFKICIKKFLNNEKLKSKISGIVSDLDDKQNLNLITNTLPSSDFTKEYLKILDFKWPIINNEYITKYITYFNNIKYF